MRVGEFEKHTKGFGSRYMSKFGFEKGKGLGTNGQGTPHAILFIKNKNKATLGAQGGLVNMTTPIRKTNEVIQESGHVKFVKRGTTCDEGAKIVASSSNKTSSMPLAQQRPRHKHHLMYPFMPIMF